VSKVASSDLARERGSFLAMQMTAGNRYLETPSYLEEKYGDLDGQYITSAMWRQLGRKIRTTRHLRNATTIALPPTGRSGLVIDASTGVEPHFSLINYDGSINRSLMTDLSERNLASEEIVRAITKTGRVGDITAIPDDLKAVYKTALEISPHQHLLMVGAIQAAVDDAISKTINVPENYTPEYIAQIYMEAYGLNLKGITIFRTNSRKIQPRKLAQ